jgi:hypothetical protein
VLSHGKESASTVEKVLAGAYANGLTGTMVVVGLLVGLLGAISLLLLVIGHQQQRAEQEQAA